VDRRSFVPRNSTNAKRPELRGRSLHSPIFVCSPSTTEFLRPAVGKCVVRRCLWLRLSVVEHG
jgi:hypothetical protein